MVRFGRYKYVHYEGYRPQLFDLEADPGETRDLALRARPRGRSSPKASSRLRAICDPAAVTARAFADQRAADRGARRRGPVLRALGSYPYTPAPGEAPRYA